MLDLWIRPMGHDFRHGFRVFRRRRALFASAVLVLGLTAGAAISLAILMDRLLLRTVAIGHPERLVQVLRRAGPGGFPEESLPAVLIGQLRDQVKPMGNLLTAGYPA